MGYLVMKRTPFKWTKNRENAAIFLSMGYTVREVSEKVGVTERTIYKWKNRGEFSAEVDRLSLMTDIAGRAERLRIAKKIIRSKIDKETKEFITSKDVLDWLKYAQSETDGVKLDLAALAEAASSMADSGSSGAGENQQEESGPTENNTE